MTRLCAHSTSKKTVLTAVAVLPGLCFCVRASFVVKQLPLASARCTVDESGHVDSVLRKVAVAKGTVPPEPHRRPPALQVAPALLLDADVRSRVGELARPARGRGGAAVALGTALDRSATLLQRR